MTLPRDNGQIMDNGYKRRCSPLNCSKQLRPLYISACCFYLFTPRTSLLNSGWFPFPTQYCSTSTAKMAFTSTNDLADLGKECLTSLFAPMVQVDNIDPSVLVADHLENLYANEAEELLAFYSESMRLTTMSLLKMLMSHKKRVPLPSMLASMAIRNGPPELSNKH